MGGTYSWGLAFLKITAVGRGHSLEYAQYDNMYPD
jgi:hypothetical protein